MKFFTFFIWFGITLVARAEIENPPTTVRILYLDRQPTAREIAAAEASGEALEPTVFYQFSEEDSKKTPFRSIALPFARLSQSITVPAGKKIALFSRPDSSSQFAEIPAGAGGGLVAVVRASRDNGFRGAKVELLDSSDSGFPWGHLRVINSTALPVAVRTLEEPRQIPPGGTLSFEPRRARRNTVPVLVGVREDGGWKEIHSGATRLHETNRATLLVTGVDGSYSAEYLLENKPEDKQTP